MTGKCCVFFYFFFLFFIVPVVMVFFFFFFHVSRSERAPFYYQRCQLSVGKRYEILNVRLD